MDDAAAPRAPRARAPGPPDGRRGRAPRPAFPAAGPDARARGTPPPAPRAASGRSNNPTRSRRSRRRGDVGPTPRAVPTTPAPMRAASWGWTPTVAQTSGFGLRQRHRPADVGERRAGPDGDDGRDSRRPRPRQHLGAIAVELPAVDVGVRVDHDLVTTAFPGARSRAPGYPRATPSAPCRAGAAPRPPGDGPAPVAGAPRPPGPGTAG